MATVDVEVEVAATPLLPLERSNICGLMFRSLGLSLLDLKFCAL
jgi:hypothetical protein